jgi:hypothetical protein
MAFVLPNRKAFADHVARIFLKYRKIDKDPLDEADTEADLCARQGDMSKGTGKLFPYQALVRDYIALESPYRGLLLYHGLGSGKTCSSIAVAEALLSQKKIIVMLPASLQDNFRGEIRKCGDPIFRRENNWNERVVRSDTDREDAKALGISDTFLGRTAGRFFVTNPGQPSNFATLSADVQSLIDRQIDDILNQRFSFINYNGLTRDAVNKLLAEGNPFENSVTIIDEAHNLISRVSNESEIASPIYNAILNSPTTKVVALSGTPVINSPREVAILMNLLRGSIERITIPTKVDGSWDEMKMTNVLRGIPEVDTIEFNATKKAILVTRNPPQFRSVYNEKGTRTAVQYVKELEFIKDPLAWVQGLQKRLETELPGVTIQIERVTTEALECLPSKAEEFDATFREGLNIKNPMLFMRRIQGLVSYFKGADERMLPKRIEDDKMLEKVVMSSEQLGTYLQTRFQEIQRDAKRRTLNDDGGTYRVGTRLICDFTVPSEVRDTTETVAANENAVPDKKDILEKIRAESAKYLTEDALAKWSPKMLRMLRNLKDSLQGDARRSQFVYSQYRSLEGLGVFSAILETHGFQRYRIINEGGQWKEDPGMEDKPAYAFYTGEEKAEEREMMRQIFNGSYTDTFPQSLKDSITARGKKLLCVLLASRSGAEGITLANVRHVHIMEPHWNPAVTEQVIGRAIRICSHASLPVSERTVRVSYYLTVIPESAKTGTDNNLVFIRRSDMELKRYEGDPPQETFMSTDEHLYEISYEKAELAKRITTLLKQAAVDCEIHRRLHLKNEPNLVCMRFDSSVSGEDLAFKPSILSDERDVTYLKNKTQRSRTLEKIMVKGCLMLRDPVTKEIFDVSAFDDKQRLLLLGRQISERQIQWITQSPCS